MYEHSARKAPPTKGLDVARLREAFHNNRMANIHGVATRPRSLNVRVSAN